MAKLVTSNMQMYYIKNADSAITENAVFLKLKIKRIQLT